MRTDIFRKPYDATLLACSVLKRLGAGNVNVFENRLKSQKIQYFAQLFGISPIYSFNLYLRGPYSPDLAHDLYEIKKRSIKPSTEKFVPDILENRFCVLEKLIKEKTTIELELFATLHWLMKMVKFSKRESVLRLKELKDVSESDIKKSFNFLEKYEKLRKN